MKDVYFAENYYAMSYSAYYNKLNAQFKLGADTQLQHYSTAIRFFTFRSEGQHNGESRNNSDVTLSDEVAENEIFQYPVFVHPQKKKYKELILLLHGLNERSWDKYLPWAEYLANKTGKAVLLFPIAYHVNRSPVAWSNPRFLQKMMEIRRRITGNDRSLSFANLALSERLSNNPHRFFDSGKQSYNDIVRLLLSIKQGRHPLFEEDASVNVFAYSIGAFLSQVAFLANPEQLFSDSKLFMFCGGSVFSSMYGQSRSIMDKWSFEKLLNYYKNEFSVEKESQTNSESIVTAFYNMLSPENGKEKRIQHFRQMKDRIGGVSLAFDTVIPYKGVVEALGRECASLQISLLDLPYEYSHENPFPILQTNVDEEVNQTFCRIFDKAVDLLA